MSPIERSGGGGSAAAGGLVKLFDSTLGASAASIDTGANGVAGGHSDLLIYIVGRCDLVVNSATVALQFNADTGANYDWIWNRNAGGVLASVSTFADTAAEIGNVPGTTGAATYPGTFAVSIPSYTQTTFFKAGQSLGGSVFATLGNTQTTFAAFAWRNTAAITRVSLFPFSGGNLIAGSRMVIYGTQ
jgi:hypothetical protein